MRYRLPVHTLMALKGGHFFRQQIHRPSSFLHVVLIMLRYVRANSRSPRVLHTCKMSDPQIARNNYSTLIYLEMGFVITSFQMKDTPVVARCQLPFDLLKLRATEAASCQLRML